MSQLIQILISILYGFIYGFIFKLISKKLFITAIVTTIITISYVALMYYINLGIINYILKLSIILGFIIFLKVSNLKKKV